MKDFKDIITDFWAIVRENLPGPVIVIIGLYLVVMFGGSKFYTSLTANDRLSDELISLITKVALGTGAVLTIVSVIVSVIILWIKYAERKKNKNPGGTPNPDEDTTTRATSNPDENTATRATSNPDENTTTRATPNPVEDEAIRVTPNPVEGKATRETQNLDEDENPKGKIDAYIVEQDEASRDRMFNDINQNVKKTYWVLGVTLSSVTEHEVMLKKMAGQRVDIRLCMMNPDIAIENLCEDSIENSACVLHKLVNEVEKGGIKLENLRDEVKQVDDCRNLLEIYHVLINVLHFKEYYDTSTDYKEKIKKSYADLLAIKKYIDKKYGAGIFDVEFADSFMPMSLTISDAKEDEGQMIVEFHLPFTNHKVLFELYRNKQGELFDVFVKFYENIWDRAKNKADANS